MAQRLATEYVNAKLQLTSNEMSQFFRMIEDQQVRLQVMILDNGNQELLLEDVAGREQVRMTFERQQDYYVCVLTCRLVHPKLTNAMRKAVSAFRGDAVVHRIYSHYTMIYHYHKGAVHRIVELTDAGERVVFQFKDTRGQLEQVFRSRLVEREIALVNGAINEWLDLRNQTDLPQEKQAIDLRLKELTHKLFILEA
ncbi:non-ribosomal peptide synthetase module [Paenibacillus sp. GCM10023252]|uniref:non-ribosomal peptide synthetase module n=1 Tax=Paenibacillus sp. GCM10023252 TaxID=3252649 RepID=UPI00361320CD